MTRRVDQTSPWRVVRRSRRKRGVVGALESVGSAHDAIYPRDAEHRYRIYAVNGNELEVLAATPTASGIGQALITIHEDLKAAGMRLADAGAIGVLDVLGGTPPTGEWIVLPWKRTVPSLTMNPPPP